MQNKQNRLGIYPIDKQKIAAMALSVVGAD